MSLASLLKQAREMGIIEPDHAEIKAEQRKRRLEFKRTWVVPMVVGIVCAVVGGVVGAIITSALQ